MLTVFIATTVVLIAICFILFYQSGKMAYKIKFYEQILTQHQHCFTHNRWSHIRNVMRGNKWYDHGPGPQLPTNPEKQPFPPDRLG